MGTLKVSGFLRGGKLNVNHIVHIPDMGDFQLLQVDRPADPYTGHNKTNDMDTQVQLFQLFLSNCVTGHKSRVSSGACRR